MNILLINPNPRNQPDAGVVVSTVPLGLLYIAAALRRAGHERIRIVDARILDLGRDEIRNEIERFAPDMVGISSMSIDALEAHALAKLVKGIAPRCKVVLGGAYATTSPEMIIQDANIDFAVVGEGERVICELAGALEEGGEVSGIKGLVLRSGGVPVINPRGGTIEDVDSIPFPAWDLLDMETYFNSSRRHAVSPLPFSDRVIPLFTSRGCPFGCIYCHNIFGKRVRLRSVENVMREIELLAGRYRAEEIEIWDDIFNHDLARAKRICAEIVRRGIKVRLSFPNGLRVDGMDEELLDALKEAGTHQIFYAIESGSPEVQKRIGKNLDLSKAREILRLTADRDVTTGCFFMIGFPDETKEEMLRTIRFAREIPAHIAIFNYVTPMPNTPLFSMLESRNVRLERTQPHHFKGFHVNLSSVGDAELKRIWARGYAGFYLRPAQLWRMWKALPDRMAGLRYIPRVLKMSVSR